MEVGNIWIWNGAYPTLTLRVTDSKQVQHKATVERAQNQTLRLGRHYLTDPRLRRLLANKHETFFRTAFFDLPVLLLLGQIWKAKCCTCVDLHLLHSDCVLEEVPGVFAMESMRWVTAHLPARQKEGTAFRNQGNFTLLAATGQNTICKLLWYINIKLAAPCFMGKLNWNLSALSPGKAMCLLRNIATSLVTWSRENQ